MALIVQSPSFKLKQVKYNKEYNNTQKMSAKSPLQMIYVSNFVNFFEKKGVKVKRGTVLKVLWENSKKMFALFDKILLYLLLSF